MRALLECEVIAKDGLLSVVSHRCGALSRHETAINDGKKYSGVRGVLSSCI